MRTFLASLVIGHVLGVDSWYGFLGVMIVTDFVFAFIDAAFAPTEAAAR